MAHKHSVYDTDLHFVIDPITRKITTECKKTQLMQKDHNSERFTFEIPRYIEGHDMSLCNVVQIHYINTNSTNKDYQVQDIYEVNDLQVSPDSEDIVIGSWLISSNATTYSGTLNFVIRFACVDEETKAIDYQWFTDIYSAITVAKTIYNVDVVTEGESSDLLEKWKEEISKAADESTLEIVQEAKKSEQAASNSASAAAQSEKNAGESATDAASSARSASDSAGAALESANSAQQSADTANTKATEASESAESASSSAQSSSTSATSAGDSATAASGSATLAESYAHGGTGTREGEDTDNAKYWAQEAKKSEQAASNSASAAAQSETKAKASATDAASSAQSASDSARAAIESSNSAQQSAGTASEKAAEASSSAQSASSSASSAVDSATAASASAILAESYTHGRTGTREGEDTDNAKYYMEQTKAVSSVNVATTEKAGIVKPDGNTITVDEDGTLHGTTIDESFSLISTNPVQNKVVKAKFDEIEEKVNANETTISSHTTALATLNGEGEGSVKKTVTDEIAKVVADAPESLDTLKEISDWISSHESDASTMNSAIQTNKSDIAILQTDKADKSEIPTTVAELTDSADYAKTADIPTTLPANGGNADTVNNHTVETDVPTDAKFTDTVYNDIEVKESINELSSNLEQLEETVSYVSHGKNLIGTKLNKFYPVYIKANEKIVSSRYDGQVTPNFDKGVFVSYDKNKNMIERFSILLPDASYRVFTMTKDVYYLSWEQLPYVDFQIEMGDVATSYEPYNPYGNKQNLIDSKTKLEEDVAELNKTVDTLKKSVSDGKTLVATAITEKGVNTAADATFAVMANNISQIETGGGELHGATISVTTSEENPTTITVTLTKDSTAIEQKNFDSNGMCTFTDIQESGDYTVAASDGAHSISTTATVTGDNIVNKTVISVTIVFTLDGSTATPLNDVSIWLRTDSTGSSLNAGHTTLAQVIADPDTLNNLMRDQSAMQYLARSTGFANEGCASETFMTYLGASTYVDSTVLNSDLWKQSIKASEYWTLVYASKTVTVYGAASETITIDGYYGSFTTGTDGSCSHVVPIDTITLAGSVSAQSFERTVTSETTEVYVMPDGALYWHGNMCTDATGGWDSGWTYGGGGTVTLLTEKFIVNALNGQNAKGLETNNKVETTDFSKLKATVTPLNSSDSAVHPNALWMFAINTRSNWNEIRNCISASHLNYGNKYNHIPINTPTVIEYGLQDITGKYIGLASYGAGEWEVTEVWLE